jgi:transcription initiation factor TFIID subunit 15
MTINGLPFETSWQDLKDFARQSGLDVVYSEVGRDRDSQGNARGYVSFVASEVITRLTASIDLLNTRLPVI